MKTAAFQLNKARRLIRTQGQQFVFKKDVLNEFREPTGQTISVCIEGVYHETTGYLTKSTTDSATVKRRSSPMILCTWEDASQVQGFSLVQVNSKQYRVGEVKNLLEANVIADISLEEVQTNG